jgi:quinol monooxygenase YgiN
MGAHGRSVRVVILWAALLSGCAETEGQQPLVRIAELEIEPAHLADYRAAVIEEIETSVRVEPGVLAIYSVALKDSPNQFRFFEIYADERAYESHLKSQHFKKYVETTRTMITSRKLLDTVPVVLGSRAR